MNERHLHEHDVTDDHIAPLVVHMSWTTEEARTAQRTARSVRIPEPAAFVTDGGRP